MAEQMTQTRMLISKASKIATMEMLEEHWYPNNVPLTETGEVDFKQFEALWKKEILRRVDQYLLNAVNGNDIDIFNTDGKTPNVDRLAKINEYKVQANFKK